MPFNVVAITSTVLAFYLGSMVRLTTRADASLRLREPTALSRLLAHLRQRCSRQRSVS